ncbi:MAG: tetratricopeptide repeat protein [Treponema sp.]|jgi:tetratricopeptide (TPR) repeat protein|nr:tetratricopeptide repeat protein [Treponema sp.]
MKQKICCLSLALLFFGVCAFADPTNYTYNYDFWNEQVTSPDAYRSSAYILGTSLGISNFRDPQGLFIRDNRVYICDSGNNRIILLEVQEDGNFSLVSVVSSVMIDGVESQFRYPMDIFEARDGYLYIADTNNQRILKLDRNWNHVFTIVKPNDESIGELAEFLPLKLVVDFANRLFVQARNINKGLIEFDGRGEFVGYMGRNKVKVKIIDYIWKLFSTQAQRARLDLFIPTEYNNLCLDREGFIYVTNSSGQTEPIRRLNAMGQDILIRNGYEKPVGDLAYGNAGGISGPSKFIDVAALDNESYACLDRTRGRIFLYDFQGNLLYAFGGIGNREGCFLQPVALANMGHSLYALDSRAASLTRFDLTGYGAKINEALGEYQSGRYESSAEVWEEVLKMNGNYDAAYIGIGRAALRQGEYQKAMKYYKLKHFRAGYGKAFQLYRKQFMEENLWKMLLALAIVILVPQAVKIAIKIRREVLEE